MSSLRLAIKQSLEGSGSTIESEQPTTSSSSSRPRPRISISLKPNSRIGSIPNTNANRQRQQQQQQRRRQQQQQQQQQQPSLNTISIVMANNKNNQQQRRKQQKLAASSATRRHKNAVVVKLPEITKCIRNSDPTLIDEFGFVEIRNALPSILIEQIYREAADKVTNLNQRSNNANSSNNTNRSSGRKRNSPSSSPSSRGGGEGTTTTTPTTTTTTTNEVEEISNALQTDVSEELFRKVKMAMEDCDIAKRTMVTVFGKKGPPTTSPSSSSSSNNDDDDDDSCGSSIHPTNRTESNYKGYVLETPKVLITPPGSPPQLPHADDHCSSCVFCLIHLRDGQEPTRVARYREDEDVDGKKKKEKDYPTGITVGCDRCNRTEQLPDKDFRRGVHLTNEKWHCNCTSPHTPYDFEHKLTESFSELLSENAPNLCDAYAGPPSPHQSSGDGFLGLPTLIHRGPGNPTSATESRFVLFLTLRPLYDNMKQMEKGQVSVDKLHHHYNPALQIHASCMLYNQFKKVNSIYERAGCGLDGYFGAIVGAETASLMSEVKRLKEENRKLKEKIVSVRKKHSRSGRDFDGDWTIDGGG